jgi:hypothetical protein
MKIGRQAIRDLAQEFGRPISTLLALVCANDPFYLSEARRRRTENSNAAPCSRKPHPKAAIWARLSKSAGSGRR